jgi:nitroimidazol reductase NimA-like FMN-containing flavoprotein (pyridoxamine 5'-phosphate oxidase superfamily)
MQKYHLNNHPDRELINQAEITAILKSGKFAVISICRDNEPYVVTLSYGYDPKKNSLYFHCSPQGLKLDFINTNPQVCATVIDDGGYVANECGHIFKSVVFWGTMKIISDLDEKKYGIAVILDHLENNSEMKKMMLLKADEYYSKMKILQLDITEIHGKAGR